jgi:ABC-type Fe3+/spermidine/putrescine transport system ATPase subunit
VDDRFRSDSGLEVPLPPDCGRSAGNQVLSIRPEKIDIAEAGRPGMLLTGTVARATRLGGLFEYAIELPTGETILVQEQSRSAVQPREPGAKVSLSWRAEDGRLLPAQK